MDYVKFSVETLVSGASGRYSKLFSKNSVTVVTYLCFIEKHKVSYNKSFGYFTSENLTSDEKSIS